MERFTEGDPVATANIIGPEDIKRASDVKSIYLDDKIEKYIVDLVFATREPHAVGPMIYPLRTVWCFTELPYSGVPARTMPSYKGGAL